jgi:hypothetical protein
LKARGTCAVGREEAGSAIAVVQFAKIGHAGDDVVVRVVGIGGKTMALAQPVDVAGMICIKPIAPSGEMACTARSFPRACRRVSIPSGTLKRCGTPATNAPKGVSNGHVRRVGSPLIVRGTPY